METTFRFASHDHSALLQQVPVNVRTSNAAVGREADADELAKPTGVVVPLSLSISKGLEDRIRLEDLSLEETKTAFRSEATEPRALTDRYALGVLSE